MPTYDYYCDACEHEFELFHSITDEPKRKCPKCGKNKLRRLIGMGAAIMFKGSGFYTTDYRSESYKKRAEADKPAASSEAKSDSKSESKTDVAKSDSSKSGKSESKKSTAKDKS